MATRGMGSNSDLLAAKPEANEVVDTVEMLRNH